MNGVGEIDDLLQEIRASAETFDDSGNLGAAGTGAPIIVSVGRVAFGLGIFGNADFCRLRVGVVLRRVRSGLPEFSGFRFSCLRAPSKLQLNHITFLH